VRKRARRKEAENSIHLFSCHRPMIDVGSIMDCCRSCNTIPRNGWLFQPLRGMVLRAVWWSGAAPNKDSDAGRRRLIPGGSTSRLAGMTYNSGMIYGYAWGSTDAVGFTKTVNREPA